MDRVPSSDLNLLVPALVQYQESNGQGYSFEDDVRTLSVVSKITIRLHNSEGLFLFKLTPSTECEDTGATVEAFMDPLAIKSFGFARHIDTSANPDLWPLGGRAACMTFELTRAMRILVPAPPRDPFGSQRYSHVLDGLYTAKSIKVFVESSKIRASWKSEKLNLAISGGYLQPLGDLLSRYSLHRDSGGKAPLFEFLFDNQVTGHDASARSASPRTTPVFSSTKHFHQKRRRQDQEEDSNIASDLLAMGVLKRRRKNNWHKRLGDLARGSNNQCQISRSMRDVVPGRKGHKENNSKSTKAMSQHLEAFSLDEA